MQIYTEEHQRTARRVCEDVIHRIREAGSVEQVNEKGWLALGHIQAFCAIKAVTVEEHCQLTEDLAAAEVQRIVDLGRPLGS